MNNSKIKLTFSAFFVATALWFASCDKILDVNNTNSVELNDHYNNFNDADNAIMGIYAKLMKLVDRVIVLNELRGDLMDVTENATLDQVALNNHTATSDNYYCNLAPFYEVILNCNDVLSNFDKMREEKKLSEADYLFRYADVMTARCWLYLQMVIHFGHLPYITQPFVTIDDLKNENLFPVMGYEEILMKLTEAMRSIPETVLDVNMSAPLFAASSSATDNINLKMFLLNKHFVFADILLYNHQYTEAAQHYLRVIEDAEAQGWTNIGINTLYKVRNGGDFSRTSAYFYIGYNRGTVGTDGYGNKWNDIFMLPSTNRDLGAEIINMFEYKEQFPLIELFAPNERGKYQIKPSLYAIDDLWEAQGQRDSRNTFDGRGRNASFAYVDGKPVIIKYLYDYYKSNSDDANRAETSLNYNELVNAYQLRGKWFIYRAGLLILRYAEAANRAGFPDLAHALLQGGIRGKYNWEGYGWSSTNVAGHQYSSWRPATTTTPPIPGTPYPPPFYLDARKNTDANEFEQYNAKWSDYGGMRNRAFVANISRPELEDGQTFGKRDSILWLESALLNEAALECGFEGFRWGDMIRIAHRRNNDDGTGTALLNDMLSKKFEKENKTPPHLTWDNNVFLPRKE